MCFHSLQAQDNSDHHTLTLNGFVKNLQMVNFYDDFHDTYSSNMFHNRISAKYKIHDAISIRSDIRNRLFWGNEEYLRSIRETLNRKPGVLGISEILVDNNDLLVHSVLDRMSITFSPKHWNITIGRQRINWGIHNVWNPNDIFNTYNILDFDYEERPGCDAIRIEHVKEQYAIELAIKPDTSFNRSIAAILVKSEIGGYDLQFLSGLYRSDFIIGGGWAGNIGDAGFKGEYTYFHPVEQTEHSTPSLSVSLQLDQTFENDWYCSIGALYNSNNQLQSLSSISSTELSPKNIFPFESSFFVGIQKQFTPIHAAGCSIIYSPFNNTMIAVPSISYNVADDIDIDFIGQLFFSKDENMQYSNLLTSLFFRSRWSF